MPDIDPTDTAPDRPDPGQPPIHAARVQVVAARQRREAMIASGLLPGSVAERPGRLPDRIGPYHIKRVIASGGMGTVYEAVQEKPRRTVALKIMKHGIASRSALRRFEYESQILARLRHAGIAQVFEAGTHDDGSGITPYFAMEYIPNALPITRYANEKELNTRQRMELFTQVCDAVHHGHQKGIIHRDLKPSNILVDSSGQVKIIDFGVARSTDSDMAVTTLQTDVGQLIGTLQYMSPEQCQADPHDIDTRSDVYALGVVFYELLCRRLPYDVTRAAMHEATRIIREEQPTRLTTINKTLRGDIETIALKALEKERGRRYQSATEFGQDIRRYLSNEPIVARPPSMAYQLRVFARRNKGVFVSLAAVMVVLLAGVITSTSLYVRAERARMEQSRERLRVESERDKAERIADFMERVLGSAEPFVARGRDPKLLEDLMDAAAQRIRDGELSATPEVELRLRFTMGETYRRIGATDSASAMLGPALELARSIYPPHHPQIVKALKLLGYVHLTRGEPEEAVKAFKEALHVRESISNLDHSDLVWLMYRIGEQINKTKPAEALPWAEKGLAMSRRLPHDDGGEVAEGLLRVGACLLGLDRPVEAVERFDEALAQPRLLSSSVHPLIAYIHHLRAEALRRVERLTEAERDAREAVQLIRANPHWGPWAGSVRIDAFVFLGHILLDAGRTTEAVAEMREFVSFAQENHPKDDLENVRARQTLAWVLMEEADPAAAVEAEALLRESAAIWIRANGDDAKASWLSGNNDSMLGQALTIQSRFTEAESRVRTGYGNLMSASKGPPSPAMVGFDFKRQALARIVWLYESWDAAEPGMGHDIAAAEWRAKLDEFDKTSSRP